jgi:hypothetical protein
MKYTINKISWNDTETFLQYYELFCLSFPDEPDWGIESINSWIREREKCMIIFGLFEGSKLIGFRHIWYLPGSHYCNVPYAGMLPEYRGQGIYPKFCQDTEVELKQMGFKIITNEVENPEMIQNELKKELAVKRINMFVKKLGYNIVKNTDDLTYERNSPPVEGDESMQKSQFEYLIGFKNLDENEGLKIDNNQISKEDYRELYWSIRDIERFENGVLDRTEILKLKPIQNFLNKLENSKYRFFDLISTN